ncbi:MAG: nucleotidyltransferase domain-containing protein [Aestuariivita sp.]|nr:nucleotidyltransferase domain-containing protein [Aestuariivita sp.]
MSLITSRQHLTSICQQAYETWPDVHAILLFGSRAKGTARPDSDWDIAVVVDDPKMKHVIQSKRTPPPAPFDGFTNLDVLTLTPEIIVQDRCAFGRIAQQIAQDGQPLIGDWNMSPNDSPAPALIDPDEWGSSITKSLNKMRMALNEIETYKQDHSYNHAGTHCGFFVDNSQMAAEYLVKTILQRRKVTPARTHNIVRLATQMRTQRPNDVAKSDWTALAARIESLNGHSHRDHQAGYGEFELTLEDITCSATRVSKTFLLLVDEVESALYPHDVLAPMGLSAACLGDDPYQALMRANAGDVLAVCARIVNKAGTVHDMVDTPKTFRKQPIEAIRSFLSLLSPIETIISTQMTTRLAALTSKETCSGSHPFEIDVSTTKTPSPFET